jgi:uncharacterized protein (TIGR00661 family)
LVRQADLLVVNGGFSAVSEALALKKPMVVIPVPRHAEQWVNGRTIQDLGVGLIGSEETLEDTMVEALDCIGSLRNAYGALPAATNGAAQASELILELAARRSP